MLPQFTLKTVALVSMGAGGFLVFLRVKEQLKGNKLYCKFFTVNFLTKKQ